MAGLYGFSSYRGLFGGTSAMSAIYSNLAQYASVRSGAYAKATKAYYAKVATSDTKTSNKSDTADTNRITSKNVFAGTALYSVKNEASELETSAKKLTGTGKDSLFTKDGYDKDAVYKAVSNFVGNYNDTVSAVKGTDNVSVNSAANSLTRMTGVMRSSLSEVGISVGTDGKLSVDEEAFKNADESKVKSLFNGSSSYAGVVADSASRLALQASSQLANTGSSFYGNSGSYYNDFASGLFYNGYF